MEQPPPWGGQGRGEGTHRQAVAPRRHRRPETTTLLLPVPQAPVALTQRVPVARASASDLPQNPHHLRQHQQQQRPGTRHGIRRNNDSNNQTAVTKRRSAGAAVAHRWSDGCSQQPRRRRSEKRRSPKQMTKTTADSEGSAPTGGERTTRDTLSASRAA